MINFAVLEFYYPFGMLQPGRQHGASDYRFGFNDKENDNEIDGVGNWQDYGLRMYIPALGRFFSVDPLTQEYPWYSPYQFAGNKPISFVDIDGAEEGKRNFRNIIKCFKFSGGRIKSSGQYVRGSVHFDLVNKVHTYEKYTYTRNTDQLHQPVPGGALVDAPIKIDKNVEANNITFNFNTHIAPDHVVVDDNSSGDRLYDSGGPIRTRGIRSIQLPEGTSEISVTITPDPSETNSVYDASVSYHDDRVFKGTKTKFLGITIGSKVEKESSKKSRALIDNRASDANPSNDIQSGTRLKDKWERKNNVKE